MKTIVDFETRSRVDIKKVGAWAYAAHPSTDVTCIRWGYAEDDGEPSGWYREPPLVHPRGAQLPVLLKFAEEVSSGQRRAVAQQVQFEYAIWYFIMHMRYGYPALLNPRWWDDTMARALSCSLPGSLEGWGMALGLPHQKDIEGYQVMMKICKPRADGTFNEEPDLYRRNYAYCGRDVRAERAGDRVLPELSDYERRIFEADLTINRRGIAIEVNTVRTVAEVAAELVDGLNKKLVKITGGALTKHSQLEEMKRWVEAQGVPVPTKDVKVVDEEGDVSFEERETLDKEAISDLLKTPGIPQVVKDVVSIRAQAGKVSVSKLQTMLAAACADGRVRGAYRYYGAHTGRWSAQIMQPHNFPQGLVGAEQDSALEILRTGDADLFKAVYDGKSLQTISDCLRGMLVPADGELFLGADYNAIECRVLNWLSGERWVIDLFLAGGTPYVPMAEAIFGLASGSVSKKGAPREYDIGKRGELGGGFGLGWRRLQAMTYTETSKRGEGVWLEDELAQRIIQVYRRLHPCNVRLWYAVGDAAVKAVLNPGVPFPVAGGRLVYKSNRHFLTCKLPSGRLLYYFRPSVRVEESPRGPRPTLYYWAAAGSGAIKTDCNGKLGWYRTWGGELVENDVQAIARDVMAQGMLNVEAAGYPVVLHTHDELLAQIKLLRASFGPQKLIKEFESLMCQVPAWAQGCPIAAEGWVGARYRK